MTSRIRMAVLATNAERAPDLYATFVEATDLQYNEGHHYDMALARAGDEDYRAPMIAFDQNDAAAIMLRYATDFTDGHTVKRNLCGQPASRLPVPDGFLPTSLPVRPRLQTASSPPGRRLSAHSTLS